MSKRLRITCIALVIPLTLFLWKQVSSTTALHSPVNFHEGRMEETIHSFRPAMDSDTDIKNASGIEPKYTSDEFQAGMNILIYGHPDIDDVKEVFQQLYNLGINSIAINFPFYQENWQANEVNTSQINTPTITELEQVIEVAHAQDLSVMLRPIMDEKNLMKDNRWRGQIEPTEPKAWFQSYQSLLLTYAKLAQRNNVELLNIGTELNSLENKFNDQWVKLIEQLRTVYKGELIYSFNWNVIQHIPSNSFTDLLDHVGIDAYFPLNVPDNASTDILEKEWNTLIDQSKDYLNHDSIIITEVGILPVAGAYKTPYAWSYPAGKLDWEVQENYYDATFTVWQPLSNGLYWWNVTLGQEDEISFSPLHSPTEFILQRHLLLNHPSP